MSDDEPPAAKAFAQAGAIFAAIIGFSSAPVLRFAAPGWLGVAGFALAIGVASMWLDKRIGGPDAKGGFSYAMAGLGALALIIVWAFANMASARNDERCFGIQREMLLPHPSRDDLPQMFEALGCRPQGDDDIQFPSPAPSLAARTSPASTRHPPVRPQNSATSNVSGIAKP